MEKEGKIYCDFCGKEIEPGEFGATGINGVFICQDSDDDIAAPIEMSEKELLPKIHHAGLPDDIASRDFQYKDSWEVGLDEFQEMKKEQLKRA